MSQPAQRTQKRAIAFAMKRQAWLLLILIIIVALLDALWWQSSLQLAQAIIAGAVLSYLGQCIVAWFAFRNSGRTRQQAKHQAQYVVAQLYRGQMLKWFITLIGFALIFINIQPAYAFAVFIGFILMQMVHGWVLWRLP